MKPTIVSLILTILFFSCDRKETLSLLDQAEHYAYQFNDSALILLETIDESKLDNEELAKYYLVTNFNKRFNAERVVCDSTLEFSEQYYRMTDDKTRLTEILLLQGWDNYYKKANYDIAGNKYKEALNISVHLNDSPRIIRTYRELSWVVDGQNMKDSVYTLLFKSLPYARDIDEINLHMYMGILCQKNDETAKALEHFKKAMKVVQASKDHYISQTVRNQIIQTYVKNEMYKEAFHELDTFRMMRKGRYETSYSTLALAEIWSKVHQYDSAYHYYSLASQSLDLHIAAQAKARLADLHHIKGDFKNGLYAVRSFIDLWDMQASNIESSHMREKYEEMKLKNELNEIKLAKKNRELYLLIFFIIVSLCSVTAYILYLRNKKNKQEQHLKQQAEILEKENKLLKQAEELSSLREKESGLREALFKKMSVFNKIPSLENGKEKQTEDKRIVLSDKDWEELIQIVNSSYDNFASRLKQQYPLLTAKDIQFCCLVKINVTLKDLSDIYCVSKAAITKKKFRIKTEKLAFTDADKSLDDFLDTF